MTGLPAAAWEICAATARGASHVSGNLPNQDAHRTTTLPDGTVVVAVADGHGGRGYVRSDTGSRLATEQALDVVSALAAGGSGWGGLRDFPEALVEGWRGAVSAHLAANPLSDAERGRATAETLADPFQLYGSTLLVAALGRDGLWAGQIGDGDIVVASEGVCRSPVAGDPRLIGNATTSLCGPSAAADFRVGVLRGIAPGDLVLLATDGYGNSFAADDWAADVLGDLVLAIERHGMDEVGRQLPSWVAQSAAVGGDDTTVVLASRRVASGLVTGGFGSSDTVVRNPDDEFGGRTVPITTMHAVGAAPAVPAAEHSAASPESGRAGTGRRGRRGAAYGLVVASAVLLGVGVFIGVRELDGSSTAARTPEATAQATSPVRPNPSTTSLADGERPLAAPPCLRVEDGGGNDPRWRPRIVTPGTSSEETSSSQPGTATEPSEQQLPTPIDPTYTPAPPPLDPTYTPTPHLESYPPGCVLSSGDNRGQTLSPSDGGS